MKRLIVIIIALLFLIAPGLKYAQVDREISDLESVYENLEYRTIAFDDLKRRWLIKDPIFVREIFNRLVVQNAVYDEITGEKLRLAEMKKKAQPIYDDRVYVELMQRWYDDEIASLKFMTEEQLVLKIENRRYLFKPMEDCVYIREVLGDRLYNMLKDKVYGMNDVTKDPFEANIGYYFDLNFNMLEPEAVFWNSTSSPAEGADKNKYLVSAFGKWGNDYICIPGWYYNDFVFGLRLAYTDEVKRDRAEYSHLYSIKIGSGTAAKQPFKDNYVKERELFNSGTNMYFHFAGNPLFWLKVHDFQMGVEGLVNLEEKSFLDYQLDYNASFFSMRNYLVFSIKQKHIVNLFDFGDLELGAGYAMHDMHHFMLNQQLRQVVSLSEPKQFLLPYGEIGVQREGGLMQHNITVQFSYNSQDQYGWVGAKALVMLSQSIGLDFRYFFAIGNAQNLPHWQTDAYYLVFSPIIRIVY